jgi:cytoskeletal protein CcmA (bactofilin family)
VWGRVLSSVVREQEGEGGLKPTTSPADRRVTDQALGPTTLIGPNTRFKGDVSTGDPVEIRGTLEGDCQTSARCVVHEGARVLGNIEAAALVIAGKVEAGLLKADKVELRATAVVEGAIRAQMIVIADGAFYKGDIEGAGATGGPPLLKDRRHSESDGPSEG